MTDDMKGMKTLMLRLEAAIARVEDIAESRGPTHASRRLNPATAISSDDDAAGSIGKDLQGKTPATESEGPDTSVHVQIKAFEQMCSSSLIPYVEAANELGPIVAEQAALISQAFIAQQNIISIAAQTCKPSYASKEFSDLLQPLQLALQSIGEIKEKNRASQYFNHLSAIADGAPALGWIAVEKTPVSYVGDMKDSAQFYGNRVIKEFKDKDPKQIQYVRSYMLLLGELQKYVKAYHLTGLTWATDGTSLNEFLAKDKVSIPAPPPPPPPGPAPPAEIVTEAQSSQNKKSGDMNSVFASLNKGASVTAGLRKVDKSQMNHKNPALRASEVVQGSAAKPTIKTTSPRKKAAPRIELEGTRWLVENFENDANVVLNDVELNHSVYVYGCVACTIQIKGKFNAITVDGCKKTGLVLETLVSSVEIVKSTSFALQILDKCPTILCDSCDSGQIYLAETGLACEILTSKCSSINVNTPGSDGDFIEQPLPEMLKHVLVDGKLTTALVEYHD